MSHPTFPAVYGELVAGTLTPATTRAVFDAIFEGAWTPVQVGAFLATLRFRGETADTIVAAAEAMRAAMVPVEHSHAVVLDTCGTGGDGHGTLNLSTGAAVVAAAAGFVVAKHGNRAASSKAGSADVLEALGVPVDLPAAAAAAVLDEVGIAFLFAPVHHPAMRHAGAARRELGIRTLFNCLGPLVNPARATHQLVGAYDDALRPVLAETLRSLGSQRAWVVRGRDGLDELSPCGPTRVTQLSGGALSELEVAPGDFGLPVLDPADIKGGDAAENAAALRAILAGQPHPAADAVVLNAAAALVVAEDMAPRAATERARETIASGAALRTLDRWGQAAQARKPRAQT